jgi:hypothetical protein
MTVGPHSVESALPWKFLRYLQWECSVGWFYVANGDGIDRDSSLKVILSPRSSLQRFF